jgi:glutathione synthase/RimK-type ligase-like ATP-grasp enzyme
VDHVANGVLFAAPSEEPAMRFLITTSRMPFALDEIRKLGRRGHEVYVTDTFRTAPGSHSCFATDAVMTPSPRFATDAFIATIRAVAKERRIDLILPAFEEALYLAQHAALLPTRAFIPTFDTLRALHNKVTFLELARKVGLRVPHTTVVNDERELRAALRHYDSFFARPAFSRGGLKLFTDTGPLAGTLQLEQCQPTRSNPWIVQQFVHGVDVCTFSVVQHGRIAAHCSYVHPREIEHAGGIVFESVDEPEALAIAQQIAAETRYHGQLSLDLRRTREGFVAIECNPRPTAGVFMLTSEAFVDALFDEAPAEPRVAPAGVRRKFSVALIRDMLLHPREVGKDLEHLLSGARDVYAASDDLGPAIYQMLSYSLVASYRRHTRHHDRRTDLMAAYFHDVLYDED